MQTTTDSPERTSFHEAGHAVAYHVLGLGVEHVTIAVDPWSGTAGRTVAATSGDQFCLAIAAYAGAEATRRWNPGRGDWQLGAETDFRQADEYVTAMINADPSVSGRHARAVRFGALVMRARAEAAQIVEIHWLEIEALARLLMASTMLKGDAVDAVAKLFGKGVASGAAFGRVHRLS